MKIQKPAHFLFIIFGSLALWSCSAATVSSDESSTTSMGSEATVETLDEGATEVGTNVGNPPVPTKNTVTFLTAATASTETSSEFSSDGTVQFSDPSYCRTIDSVAYSGETQQCGVTPDSYSLGVLAIYLAKCLDSTGSAAPCDTGDIAEVNERATLYSGDQVDMTITADGSDFSGELSDITSDMSDAGGLQIVTSYIGQKFPNADSNATEAAKIVGYLQGKTYRVCTTPEDQVETIVMAARCGNAYAQNGDFLIDLDEDGVFGFMNPETLTADSAEEIALRPEDYSRFTDALLSGLIAAIGNKAFVISSTDYYDTDGHLAPLLPFETIQSVTVSQINAYTVSLDTLQNITFVDGAVAMAIRGFICVDALSLDGCAGTDNDPASVGIYNPYYDANIFNSLPNASVTSE